MKNKQHCFKQDMPLVLWTRSIKLILGSIRVLTMMALLLCASGASAQSLTWDNGTANTGTGSGDWDTTTTNWWNGSSDVALPPTSTTVATDRGVFCNGGGEPDGT